MAGRAARVSLAGAEAGEIATHSLDLGCGVCGAGMVARKAWLAECPACGFLASSLPAGAGTGIEGLEAIRLANFDRILDRLQAHRAVTGARILEVGCAKGLFLEAAARRGAKVHAIEPELANAQFARSRGFAVESGFFPQDLAERGPYDIIVFNDVFEHLPDPAGALRAVEQLLQPGGIVVLNLPTSDGFLYQTARVLDRVGLSAAFERLWQKGLPSPHVSYFNQSNLLQLAAANTTLQPIDAMQLASVERDGLRERVKSVNRGLMGEVLFAGAFAFTYVAELLPSDIMAVLLMRPRT